MSSYDFKATYDGFVIDEESRRKYASGRAAIDCDRKGNLIVMTPSGEIPLPSNDRIYAESIKEKFMLASFQAKKNLETINNY
jgi:hypothetical protein